MISDTPPTLQPDTISPYSRVAIDTHTHNARTTNIAHPVFYHSTDGIGVRCRHPNYIANTLKTTKPASPFRRSYILILSNTAIRSTLL